MPVHDWTQVFDGAFHDFHHAWIAELRRALNDGGLPPDYYAMAEQVARPTAPDVLTLQTANGPDENSLGEPVAGATAVATAPPRVCLSDIIEEEIYARRQRSIVIRHSSDDRIVAVLEIRSAGNKSSNKEFRSFVAKAVDLLDHGYHLLLVDLHPPTPRDPDGIHPVIWAEFGGRSKPALPDKPLTLVAYDAGPPKTCYVEPVAVGDGLIDMPLFLAPGWYVSVPLEMTYQAAWRGVPRRFRAALEDLKDDR
ncbi:MAG: DUF4058 family protein [Isosphaeraceae bacterium]